MLYGEDGDDTLLGGDGTDMLRGGRGDDDLTGGDATDSFRFGAGFGIDTVRDFSDEIDTLQLYAASLGVVTVSEARAEARVIAGDTVFTFNTGDILIVSNIANESILANDIILL